MTEQELQTTPTVDRDSDRLTPAQRRAGLYTVFMMLVLLAFFLYHQVTQTGFFTEAFKWPEMLALYVPIVVSMSAPLVRYFDGRRQSAIVAEMATDFSLAAGSLILFIVFPFDFSHLADPLPANAQFILSWINNTIGKVVLGLQVVIGALSGLARTRDYMQLKRNNP